MERTIEFTKKIKITDQDIDDIMCSALEGGINYWCRKVDVIGKYLGEYASEQISRGGELILYDAETSDKWTLTFDKFCKGIKLAAEDNHCMDYDWINGDEIDTCMIDAELADCIVQFALFGEIVFG